MIRCQLFDYADNVIAVVYVNSETKLISYKNKLFAFTRFEQGLRFEEIKPETQYEVTWEVSKN